MKKLIAIDRNENAHWVGDGFPVRTILSVHSHGESISPFLLLDYAGPADFPPSEKPRGVEQHPHRGFETVTIVFQGELEHRDSAGNHGRIGPGDVQWMTAASGVVHEEFHSHEFTQRGGTFEVVQLWVNLPARFKMTPPRYQELLGRQIPTVPIAGGSGTARVIAGDYNGTEGPAHTFTPIILWDLRLKAGHQSTLTLPNGFTTAIFVRTGQVLFQGQKSAGQGNLARFERQGETIVVEPTTDADMLVLSGEPIDEPVASYGPFVMNTQDEIRQAIDDYRLGRMGQLATRGSEE